MNDITFYPGLTKEELIALFDGLSLSSISLGSYGLKGFLENKGASPIQINQVDLNLRKKSSPYLSR